MGSFKKILTYGLLLNVGVAQMALSYADKAQKLKAKTFTVCGKKLSLEIARNESERSTGLMHRESVPKGSGMLFIFPEAIQLNFWMRNVPMDIDIGYFNAQGELLNSHTMSGTSPLMRDEMLPQYPSKGLAQFAVEAEAGFYKNGKEKGCKLSPLPQQN